jgi:hypothetical protein
VFEGELSVAADKEREEPKQVEHEGDHEPRLWPDGADRSTTWLRDEVLARDSRTPAEKLAATLPPKRHLIHRDRTASPNSAIRGQS